MHNRIIPVFATDSETHGVHARTVLAAAESLGGLSDLADYLKVPRAEVFRWALGDSRPPEDLFLQAVDLLLDDNQRFRGNLKPYNAASDVATRPGE